MYMFFKIKEILDAAAWPIYSIKGRRPWTLGYYTEKKKTICHAIDNSLIKSNHDLPLAYGRNVDERCVEYPWVYNHLKNEPGKVLDAGSAFNHRFLLERVPLKNAELTIMTLAPEKRCFWNNKISYVFGDLRESYFLENYFDVVVSVSTIEHVGLDNTMLYTGDSSKNEADQFGFIPAVAEFKRVLKRGGTCLVTVPFGRRGIHGWYQVFDIKHVMMVVDTFKPSEYSIEYFGYDQNGWQRSTSEDIADVEFFDVHQNKTYDSDRAAGARGVACIRMVA